MELDANGIKRFATSITCCAIVIISVALRFWCKLSLKSGIHAEDWVIFAVVPAYIGATADDIWGLLGGGHGKEIDAVVVDLLLDPSPKNFKALEVSFESLFVGFFLSPFGLTATRISICLLYRRIFSTRNFRIQSMIMMIISIAWLTASFVVNVVLCIPLDTFWKPFNPGRCVNFNLYYLLIGIFETIIDSAILALPIRATFQVQLPLKTKLLLSGIFLLGGFVIVTNAFRLSAIYQPNSTKVSLSEATFWTHIHSTTAVLCANIPIYKPLVASANNLFGGIRNIFYSSFRSLRSNQTMRIEDSADDPESGFQMVNTTSHPDVAAYHRSRYHLEDSRNPILVPDEGVNVTIARCSDMSLGHLDIPQGRILHTRKVEVA
ncbi:uncharacterized protein GGS22DRAFT_50422 [Annulohypoxylon maeteangense]|uniref:uncharacterized protein n=1 Tax=Annulohypoxylon maeteangense TaxID=1927788 RepID=UPI002008E21C|nr:uncharacterized protein GGS22DRAFT_50422 [Annulohypoxylon maeteangense]KAI0882333.1 hypothetical protein GGS22DRAFT_50422 [Annulohypoxylon maeteangense]